MLRKRGRLAVTTTGSRTIMSAEAAPTFAPVQATAVMRTAPLKEGRSKRDFGLAVGADLHDAREQSQRRLRRQIAFEGAAAVAADMQRADDALHAVDQIAVEIADIERELALAEEIAARVGRLIMGEVEDADVDGGDRHPRLLAGARAPQARWATRMVWRGRVFSGALMETVSLCAASSMRNHATPMARAGMRFCLTSSGRWVIATA